MNIVNAGAQYKIYGEAIKTYKMLPSLTYQVHFSKLEGFSLVVRNDLKVSEEKIYGACAEKVDKALSSYKLMARNLGVLLSGQKGIGKSLFVRLLAEKAIQENYPVITVDNAIPGIAGFIALIDQECVVVFDEFEKTFTINEEENHQDELLSLFDGMDGGHKLFVVTCNDLNKISEYMINRPGRFHYHFALTTPTPAEVEDYMRDKLLPQYHEYIHDIVNFTNVVNAPYDWLRAIAFELNQGYSFKEVMSDLNITKDSETLFDVVVFLSNGFQYEAWGEEIDLNEHEYIYSQVRRYGKDIYPRSFYVSYIPSKARISEKCFVIKDQIHLPTWGDDDFEGTDEEKAQLCKDWNANIRIEKILLKKLMRPEVGRYIV